MHAILLLSPTYISYNTTHIRLITKETGLLNVGMWVLTVLSLHVGAKTRGIGNIIRIMMIAGQILSSNILYLDCLLQLIINAD